MHILFGFVGIFLFDGLQNGAVLLIGLLVAARNEDGFAVVFSHLVFQADGNIDGGAVGADAIDNVVELQIAGGISHQIGSRLVGRHLRCQFLQLFDCIDVYKRQRKGIVTAVHSAKSGHPGGSLSSADIFTYLYFKEMNVDPKEPQMPERDRFVLSKGHVAPGYYSTLAHRGFFPVEDLKTLRHTGSYLQGHPDKKHIPGVDMSSGSLEMCIRDRTRGENHKHSGRGRGIILAGRSS